MTYFSRALTQNALRQHSKTFYLASLFLGKKTAQNVTRLYSFCRSVDDLADKEPNKELAMLKLTQWQAQIQTRCADDPMLSDALQLADKHQLDCHAMVLLIDGAMSDLHPVRMVDADELTGYCFLVAGTVGILMCQLLGARAELAKKFAIDLAIAMQLTNMLRDVAEDAAMGRQYIPQAWLPVEVDVVDSSTANRGQIKPALKRLFWLAERYYESGYAGLRYLPLRHRFCVLIAARLYQEIGMVAQRRGFDAWDKRIVVSFSRKIWLIGVCMFTFVCHLGEVKKSTTHDKTLHEALTPWLKEQ